MRSHRSRTAAAGVALVVIFGAGMLQWPLTAQQSLVLYDDFNAKSIDPDLWRGQDFDTTARDRRETVREISGNVLRLAARLYSDPLSSGVRNGGSMVRFTDPGAVKVVKAQLRVMDVDVSSCSPETQAIARGTIQGVFFNTGGGAPPVNQTGDVRAGIAIRRTSDSLDPPGILRGSAFVNECVNAQCTVINQLGTALLGTVDLKKKVDVKLEWDEGNNQFVFQLDESAPNVVHYAVSDDNPPIMGEKIIYVAHTAPGCGGGLRSVAYMDLHVDNVYVNAEP